MGSRKQEETPVLLKVAAILAAMWADLPTPLKMSFPPASIVASTARAVATNSAPEAPRGRPQRFALDPDAMPGPREGGFR